MEVVSTLNEESLTKVVRGSDIFWFRFVYFTAGATYAINNGVDTPILNYEAIRSARGFDYVTFKGLIVAEVGHGSDDPFPGNITGTLANRPTYSIGTNTSTSDGTTGGVVAVTCPTGMVLRLRRVTIINPGFISGGFLNLIGISTFSGFIPNVSTPATLSKSDPLDADFSAYVGGAAIKSYSVTTGTLLAQIVIPLPAPVGSPTVGIPPLILDFQGQNYLKSVTARSGETIAIVASNTVFADLIMFSEFTLEPY